MLSQEVPVASLICEAAVDGAVAEEGREEALSPIVPTADGLLPETAFYGGLRILSFASNRIVSNRDATAHSELIAIRAACRQKRSERLPDALLITTLEPCLMCAGAIVLARLKAVYFFAPSLKGAGLRWLLQESRHSTPLNHYPLVEQLTAFAPRYSAALRRFFALRR